MADEVLTERHGKILKITLNRPDAMNAVNGALAEGLVAACAELDGDAGLTAGVLAGNGRGFSAGMDPKAFTRGEDLSALGKFFRNGARKPLIAAIEGFALAGGLEIALTCDLLVASKGSKLGIPEAQVGLFAAGGGLMRLPSRVGFSKAMEMALTAEPIRAEEAFERGLLCRLTEKGEAAETAVGLAERIARNAPLSVETSKLLTRAAAGISEKEFWELQRSHEMRVFTSQDAREGARAFAEKRAPEWTGS